MPVLLNSQPSTLNLAVEKWPFFALAAFFSGLTYWIQKNHAAVVDFGRLGLDTRISNAVSSYLQYLAKLFWPAKLAVFIRIPKATTAAGNLAGGAVVAGDFGLVRRASFRRPYLAVGWFWYLGTIGAHHRPGAGWRTGHGRPLHLPSVDRSGHQPGLAGGGIVPIPKNHSVAAAAMVRWLPAPA